MQVPVPNTREISTTPPKVSFPMPRFATGSAGEVIDPWASFPPPWWPPFDEMFGWPPSPYEITPEWEAFASETMLLLFELAMLRELCGEYPGYPWFDLRSPLSFQLEIANGALQLVDELWNTHRIPRSSSSETVLRIPGTDGVTVELDASSNYVHGDASTAGNCTPGIKLAAPDGPIRYSVKFDVAGSGRAAVQLLSTAPDGTAQVSIYLERSGATLYTSWYVSGPVSFASDAFSTQSEGSWIDVSVVWAQVTTGWQATVTFANEGIENATVDAIETEGFSWLPEKQFLAQVWPSGSETTVYCDAVCYPTDGVWAEDTTTWADATVWSVD